MSTNERIFRILLYRLNSNEFADIIELEEAIFAAYGKSKELRGLWRKACELGHHELHKSLIWLKELQDV